MEEGIEDINGDGKNKYNNFFKKRSFLEKNTGSSWAVQRRKMIGESPRGGSSSKIAFSLKVSWWWLVAVLHGAAHRGPHALLRQSGTLKEDLRKAREQ